MKVSPVRQTRCLALCLVAATALAVTGCFLKPKKKTGRKGFAVPELIDRNPDTYVFARTGDGDAASFQFKTLRPALCELALYSQDPSVKPTKDEPTVIACSSPDKPRTEFTEKLANLRTDTLYVVEITAWEPAGSKDKADWVPVKEPGDPNVSPGAGDGTKLTSLFVARLDMPLKAAEFHRHDLGQVTDLPAIRSKLARKAGCQVGVPDKAGPFRQAAADMKLKDLATRDFGAGTAAQHPDYAERLRVTYPSLNDGAEKWSLLYSLDGKDVQVSVRPLSRIVNMEMESTDIHAFEAPQLAEAADVLKIDPAKPLKLAWTTGGKLPESSYLTVQIGRPDNDKSVYCIFAAEKLKAEIEPKYLQGLDEGRHVVLAELTSNQIWAKDGWLVTTYDWRSGRIEK